VGLVLDREGFPKAHEVLEGNRQDRQTVSEMLKQLEKRTGKKPGWTVVVDRGMAYEENLEQIRAHGLHYIVAGRQGERNPWWEDFEQIEVGQFRVAKSLQKRIEKGQLQEREKIHQKIGRLQERYPRVARYCRIDYRAQEKRL